jgi:membrane-associated phospholipid phosphatase
MAFLRYSLPLVLAIGVMAQDQPPATQAPLPADQSPVISVTPGPKVIKPKDLWDGSGYFHPFGRMPRYILRDQIAIWTSPFHTDKSDVKWWAIFGGATAAAIATDEWSARQLPNTSNQVRLGNYISKIGSSYTLVPLSAGFYFLGTAVGNQRFRETGLLAFETLIDGAVVNAVLKAATQRDRPLAGNGEGEFWAHRGFNSSFPSGHAANTWALASVFAHQYRHKLIVPVIAYTLAAGVTAARVSARRHFPGDVVAGGAMGWFIGDYVYGRRHNPDLAENQGTIRKILSHVRIGDGFGQ